MLTKEYKNGIRKSLLRCSLRKILFISFLSWAGSIFGQETYEVVSLVTEDSVMEVVLAHVSHPARVPACIRAI